MKLTPGPIHTPLHTRSIALHLFRLMFFEEWRQSLEQAKRRHLLLFPVLVSSFTIVFVIGMRFLVEGGIPGTDPERVQTFTWNQLKYSMHIPVVLFSLGMGTFAFMAKDAAARRGGNRAHLITIWMSEPVDPRVVYFTYYVKEVVFYLLMILGPIAIGMSLGILVSQLWSLGSPLRVISVLWVLIGLSMTLSYGIALSFAATSLLSFGRRGRWAVLFLTCWLSIPVILEWIPLHVLIPGLAFQINHNPLWIFIWALETIILALFGSYMVRVEQLNSASYTRPWFSKSYRYLSILGNGRLRILVAKEFADLARSGTIAKMTASYAIPLFVLLLIASLVDVAKTPIPFNLLSYAPFLGFFGFNFYSWLNGIDRPDAYDTYPITVPDLIRAKVAVYLLSTTWISILFLILMAWRLDQWAAFFPALIVMLANSIYIVSLTAFLMGLSPNKAIFDVSIMSWFYLFTTIPLMMLFLLSFTQGDTAILENLVQQVREGGLDAAATKWDDSRAQKGFSGILMISASLVFVGVGLLAMISRRWSGKPFSSS